MPNGCRCSPATKSSRYSDEYWKLIRQFADFMAQYHQNMIMVSPLDLAQITFKDDKWSFDFSRFDKMVQTFVDAGVVGRIEGGHIGGRSSEDWNSPFFVRVPKFAGGAMQFVNLPATDAAVRGVLCAIPARAWPRHLAERGWDKIYRQHLADEPIHGKRRELSRHRQAASRIRARRCASWTPRRRANWSARSTPGCRSSTISIATTISSASARRPATKSGSTPAADRPATTRIASSSCR